MHQMRKLNRDGFSLFEVMIAMAIIALAFLALMTALTTGMREDVVTKEQLLAMQSARATVEVMRNTTFSEIYKRYNSVTTDDPSTGSSPGSTFTITGLTPATGYATVGRIEFPEIANALREDVTDTELGMPRDLDGNGAVGATSVSTTYRLLPVRIVIQWKVPNGSSTVKIVTFLAPK